MDGIQSVKIHIDKTKCYMSGECYYNHPEIFKMDEEGYPEVIYSGLDKNEIKQHAQEAAEVCPAAALKLEL